METANSQWKLQTLSGNCKLSMETANYCKLSLKGTETANSPEREQKLQILNGNCKLPLKKMETPNSQWKLQTLLKGNETANSP